MLKQEKGKQVSAFQFLLSHLKRSVDLFNSRQGSTVFYGGACALISLLCEMSLSDSERQEALETLKILSRESTHSDLKRKLENTILAIQPEPVIQEDPAQLEAIIEAWSISQSR